MKGVEYSENRDMPVAYPIPQCAHWGMLQFLPQAETQTTPFIRSIVGDSDPLLRNGSRLARLPFLRLCSGSPPLPTEARFGGVPFFPR